MGWGGGGWWWWWWWWWVVVVGGGGWWWVVVGKGLSIWFRPLLLLLLLLLPGNAPRGGRNQNLHAYLLPCLQADLLTCLIACRRIINLQTLWITQLTSWTPRLWFPKDPDGITSRRHFGIILVSFWYHFGGSGGSGWLGVILVGLVAPAGLVSF